VARLGAGDGEDDVAARLRAMDEAGVDAQVLSTSALVPEHGGPEVAGRAASIGNEALAAIVARVPGRFAYFGILPMSDPGAAIAAVDPTLAGSGCVGINVPTSIGGRSIADEAFDPLFAELDRRSAVLFVHPAGTAADSSLVRSLGFDWLVGAPIESTIVAVHLIARGIPSRFPRLRIVIAQLGGALPLLIRRLDNLFPRVAPDAPEPPSVAVRRLWFDTVTHGYGPALAAGVAAFGSERLVLGTDYPYVRGEGYRESVAFMAGAGVTADDIEAILDRNGARLTGLAGDRR
jgi:aminocarboxymuconate-semialdehyde decarboxylase